LKKNCLSALTLVLIYSVFIFGQTDDGRGIGVKVKDKNGNVREVKLYDASYALVIGNSNYKFWSDLNGVKSDVSAIEKTLKDNGFAVETAMDLDSKNLSQRIEQFVKDHGYEENNRLLIYFAGHGYTQKAVSLGDDRELGYIVPIDAPWPLNDRVGFLRTAVDLEEIRTFAKKIQAKHALFIFDSCFSGKLISRGENAVPSIILESVAFPVRQFITAGSADQSVPDESIFRRAFIRGIEGEADLNQDGFVLASELASYLRDKVTNLSNRRQTPLYAKIDDISLERGDFVFVVPGETPTPTPTPTLTPTSTQLLPKPTPLPTPTPVGVTPNVDTEEIYWQVISKRDNKSGYELYLAEYPKGKYTAQANNKIKQFIQADLQQQKEIEKSKWREARNQNTRDSYNSYLKTYPNGEFAEDAHSGIKALDRQEEQNKWFESNNVNSKEAYQSYLTLYPNGEFESNAKSKIKEIEGKKEQTNWDEVQILNRKSAYQSYLSAYPNGKYASNAKQKIKEFDDEDARKLKEQEKAKERAKWEEVERQKTVSGYKDYLKDYPKGEFGSLARLRLRDLGEVVNAPAAGSMTSDFISSIPAQPIIFPITHRHSGQFIDDDLCVGRIIVGNNFFEFQTLTGMTMGSVKVGPHDFRTTFKQIYELKLDRPEQGGHIQVVVGVINEDGKEKRKKYDFYNPQAILADKRSRSGAPQGKVIQCNLCNNSIFLLYDLLRKIRGEVSGKATVTESVK
jgi:hypothetical protein